MAETSVSFLSSRGRGISNDIKVIQTGLGEQIEDVSFRYFVTSEVTESRIVKKSHKAAKKKFCEEMTNVVCVDVSLEPSRKLPNTGGKRILEAIPYGYQFDYARDLDTEQPLKDSLKNFTHVFAPSPFTADLLKKRYDLNQIQLVEGFCSPFAWDLNQQERQIEKREKLEYLFPGMKGKKILVISTTGKCTEENEETYLGTDMKAILDLLGEDWFLLTNCETFLNCTGRMPYRYHTRFGFANHSIAAADMLYVADALITNSSNFASAFASRRCPTYCLQYSDGCFEEYVAKQYPELCVKNLLEFVKEAKLDGELQKEQKRFCERFSYEAKQNPVDKIYKILMEE